MALDPWSYAEKTGKEHAHQAALFMWANMAMRFGPEIANMPEAYTVKAFAKTIFDTSQIEHNIKGKNARPIPQLKWLHAIHNQGHGDAIRGARAKAEGVKVGVADLFLPVPIMGQISPDHVRMQHGLYVELKVGNNKPSAEQLEFIDDMRAAGYAADWVVGWQLARERILAYLQISC